MILIKSVLGLVAVLVTLCMLAVRLQNGADLPLVIINHNLDGLVIRNPADGATRQVRPWVNYVGGVSDSRLIVVDQGQAMQIPLFGSGEPTRTFSLAGTSPLVLQEQSLSNVCFATYYDTAWGTYYAADLCTGTQVVLGIYSIPYGWSPDWREVYYVPAGDTAVFARDMDTGEARQVSSGGAAADPNSIEPSGALIIRHDDRYTWIDKSKGQERDLLRWVAVAGQWVDFDYLGPTFAIYRTGDELNNHYTLYWHNLQTDARLVVYAGEAFPSFVVADEAQGGFVYSLLHELKLYYFNPSDGHSRLLGVVDDWPPYLAHFGGHHLLYVVDDEDGQRVTDVREFDLRQGALTTIYRGPLTRVFALTADWLIVSIRGDLVLIRRADGAQIHLQDRAQYVLDVLPIEADTAPRGTKWRILVVLLLVVVGLLELVTWPHRRVV